ncbi:hypothetical protein CFR79_11585 [Komagataeibacter saccharivorans]|nr:hypothetical protein CFR79_11585 [Komagataeibacter saccharivorans]
MKCLLPVQWWLDNKHTTLPVWREAWENHTCPAHFRIMAQDGHAPPSGHGPTGWSLKRSFENLVFFRMHFSSRCCDVTGL